MASLSLKHIYKVYDDTTKAVNDFNMEIRDREFIVFVGPSGCGKSTTLRMIAGLEDISAGELRIDDVVVNDMEPRDRNIAMVFQNYALYPHMTVYENMAFSLRTAHVPKGEIHEKVTEAARILGITEYLERKPRALSGGQRQRVALGRAIVRNPKVFLFDEPLSNLDAKLRAAMRAEIIRLYERLGTTFIYVTHDQVEAMTMGSRIVVMRGGFVQQIDTPRNLYNHPANLFVAGFIGTPRMNFWNGHLQKDGDRVIVTPEAGEAFSAPYRLLDRVQTRYMDGRHPVVIGVRPDDVRPWTEGLDPTAWAKLTVTVSVVEALGGETLVYARLGQFDLSGEVAAAATDGEADVGEVILKAPPEFDVHRGDIISVAVNLAKLHIFDRKTEGSLKPRLPVENVCPCTVADGILTFVGQRFPLPPALAGGGETDKKSSCEGELILPSEAILLGTGAGRARVEAVEPLSVTDSPDGGHLYRLTIGGEVFFTPELGSEARYAVGDTVPFDVDFSRITVETAGISPALIISPLPTENRLNGRFIKEKVLDDREGSPTAGRRIWRFCEEIADQPIEADKALSEKLFSCKGSSIFGLELAYLFPADAAMVLLREPRSCRALGAKVSEVLDFGRTTYLRASVGTQSVIVPCPPETRVAVGDRIFLVLDQSRLSVVDRERDMIIV